MLRLAKERTERPLLAESGHRRRGALTQQRAALASRPAGTNGLAHSARGAEGNARTEGPRWVYPDTNRSSDCVREVAASHFGGLCGRSAHYNDRGPNTVHAVGFTISDFV